MPQPPIPPRLLLAARPEQVMPVLPMEQCVLTRHLHDQARLGADEGRGGAVTLIKRFGAVANLDTHRHCPILDGMYRCGVAGVPAFIAPLCLRGK